MEQSANLQLPYIMPSQAQKHVTHNEAIRALDALVQLAILDRDLSIPPVSPAAGDRYLVAAGGADAWAGKDGKVAAWQDGAWAFLAPKIGWLLWIADEDRLISFDGTAWIDAAVHSVNPAPLVGVNATADATDRLTVKSPASLFDEETGDHRLKINKAAAGDTASLVFQSGYSGRAEFGLAGDDDWHVKVSADGAVWTEALKVDRATGRVRLPVALPLSDENQIVAMRHVRERLAANRTYYVRTDGNDSNDGLANSSAGAFLTVQKAVDTVASLDMSTSQVTITVGAGTFAETVALRRTVGALPPLINGAGATSTLINKFSASYIFSGWRVTNVGLTGSGGIGLHLVGQGSLAIGAFDFGGATRLQHARAETGFVLSAEGNFSISTGTSQQAFDAIHADIAFQGRTITVTANISVQIMFSSRNNSYFQFWSGAFSLGGFTVTGRSYRIVGNAVLEATGVTIPGTIAGDTQTGGQFI